MNVLSEKNVNPFVYPGLSRELDRLLLSRIVDTVLQYYGYNAKKFDLYSKNNTKEIIRIRWMTWYFAKKYTRYSNLQLGHKFGNRSPATVSKGVSKIKFFYTVYDKDRKEVDELDRRIRRNLYKNGNI